MKCFQCKLPITEGEPHVEIEGKVFHASQIQCSVAIERERSAKIAEARGLTPAEKAAAIRSGK